MPSNPFDFTTKGCREVPFRDSGRAPAPGSKSSVGAFEKHSSPGPSHHAPAATSLPRSSRMTCWTSCMLLRGAWLWSTFSVLVYSSGSR